MKPYQHFLHFAYLCITAVVGSYAADHLATGLVKDVPSTPLPLLARNQLLYDGRDLLIGTFPDAPERLRITGAAAQIWNWDKTWYSNKAYSRAIARAHNANAGLRIVGNVLYP